MRLFSLISLMECESVPDPMKTMMKADRVMRPIRHVDLKGNLIKAMMVMNWLNMLEVEKF